MTELEAPDGVFERSCVVIVVLMVKMRTAQSQVAVVPLPHSFFDSTVVLILRATVAERSLEGEA